MHIRDLAIRIVTLLAVCATVATSEPATTTEVALSRDALPDADVRNVSLQVLGAIGVSEGLGSNTNEVAVSFVP